jgi:gluconate:H+ symporter, GntP family
MISLLTGPFGILLVSVAFIVLAIAVLRLHAFLALMLAAVLCGLLTAVSKPGAPGAVAAVDLAMTEFGVAAGRIGFVIAMAAVIGVCLLESGAADRIVRALLAAVGEKRAGLAMLAAGFLLSIPVFFDTVFFLLLPIAAALARRTGRDYLFYVLALCGGGVITHSTVPPTPGPLVTAELLQLDLGTAMVVGILAGILPAAAALGLARVLATRFPLDQPAAGTAGGDPAATPRPSPALAFALLPVVLPVLLIAAAALLPASAPGAGNWREALGFAGNKNIALFLGAVAGLGLLWRSRPAGQSLADVIAPPLETAGVIILITAAGGAYGAMIKHSGLGDAVQALAAGRGLDFVLLGWTLAVVVRVAQGSATVAMLTTAGILMAMAGKTGFGCHPAYVFLAIGYGSFFCSWMNDSGFWLVSRMTGMSEGRTLRTWTVLLTALSVLGGIQTWIVSRLLPFVP